MVPESDDDEVVVDVPLLVVPLTEPEPELAVPEDSLAESLDLCATSTPTMTPMMARTTTMPVIAIFLETISRWSVLRAVRVEVKCCSRDRCLQSAAKTQMSRVQAELAS